MHRAITIAASIVCLWASAPAVPAPHVVVDVRRDEEFNGWTLHGEPRGGHVPGAVQLPVEWLTHPDGSPLPGEQVRAILAQHGLSEKMHLEVAATGAERVARAVKAFRTAGVEQVSELAGGLDAYLKDASRPLESLEGHALLVPPEWLDAALKGRSVEAPPRGRVVVLEVSWGKGEKSFDPAHIPGAHHLDTNDIEKDTAASPRGFWRLVPVPNLRQAFAKLGVGPDTTLVVYSNPNYAAARAGWAAQYAGVKDVRLLNGGLKAWQADGRAVEAHASPPATPVEFVACAPMRQEVRHSTDWVRQHLLDRGQALCDIRSWKEFTGEITGYDDVTGRGRIPGAIWVKGGANSHTLVGDYEDEDGTFRSYVEVAAMWKELGVPADKPMTFYCGTGWRASVGWYYARMMGRPSPAVYDSGWMDWCMGAGSKLNPIVRGAP